VCPLTGSYVLIITLDRDRTIEVGALGPREFAAGAYAYVGSAMGGLDARIARHLRDDKRLHWHVDYLLQHARVADVVRIETQRRVECETANALAERVPAVAGFGCSDCSCEGHLFGPVEGDALTGAVAQAVGAVRD